MDGLETLSALRELSPGLPFILASGYSEEEVLQGIRDEKPHAFLSKPYRREQLCEALRLALGTQVSSDGERG
jgi:CheY-like chemotaxis protein